MSDTPVVWMIYYEDAGVRPEVIWGERPARERFEAASISYNCHLFVQASELAASQARVLEQDATIAELRTRYLQLTEQHARLCDQVYEEDGETLIQDGLRGRLDRSFSTLYNCDNFVDQYVDIRDGEDGPLPNAAMSLQTEIEQTLAAIAKGKP